MGARDEVVLDAGGVTLDERRGIGWVLAWTGVIAAISVVQLLSMGLPPGGWEAAMSVDAMSNPLFVGLLGLAIAGGVLLAGLSLVHHTRIQLQPPYLRVTQRSVLRTEVAEIPLDRIERVDLEEGTPGVRLEADGRVFCLAAHAPVQEQRRLFTALQQASTAPSQAGHPDDLPVALAALAARHESR